MPAKILIVDDNEDTTALLQMVLSRDGREVVVAEGVDQALELVAIHAFDLVVSDIGLRDGTGLDLMRRLCELKRIPGIALSGHGSAEDIADSRAAGFDAHLVKPVSLDVLEEAVQRLLR
jgi:CheY-like chemotaxis protein